MNCSKTLDLIKHSQELHNQALVQIQQFSDTHFRMRAAKDLNIFTELRAINREYENLKKQINENLNEIENLLITKIDVQYAYTNPRTNQIEFQEDIKIDIEQQIEEHIGFYQKTNIDLPSNFTETAIDIWNRNYNNIRSQIEQFGFNGLLIVPGNIPLGELSEKMKIEDGYRNWITGSGEVISDLKNVPLQSTGADKPRIILYHNKSLPEIRKQNRIDINLNIKAKDAQELFDKNPDKYLRDIKDLIIMMKKEGIYMFNPVMSGAWLPTTKGPDGTRFVYCYWEPGYSALDVHELDAENALTFIGCRPAHYFV